MQLESFIEVTPIPGVGMTSATLFTEALLALRNAGVGRYAISFPQAVAAQGSRIEAGRSSLGEKLQIFGPLAVMTRASEFLGQRFEAYLDVNRVLRVTTPDRYVSLTRVRNQDRTPATIEREIRRAQARAADGRRIPLSEQELIERRKTLCDSDLPYLRVRSHTTGRLLSIHFSMTIRENPVSGAFDQFGFGRNGATVPFLG